MTHTENVTEMVGTYEYDPVTLLMLIPVAITIWIAIKTGDIIIATTIGSVAAGLIGVLSGQFDFLQVDKVDAVRGALFTVSGEGLDRTVGGIIQTGLSSMLQVCILALLLFGSISIMRAGGGDIKTAQERRLMADQKRFKQKRDFKTRLGEQPEERELSGDRNFGKGKYAREDRKFGRDDRKFGRDERGFGRKDNADRPFRKDSEERSFKRGGGEGRDFKRGGEGRDFKRGGDKFGKKNFERRNDKTFNKFRRDNED
jgi:hypothetical protein